MMRPHKSIKCRLGFHNWRYFAMSWEFIRMFPSNGNIGRDCRCCRRLEYLSDDGKAWHAGARGTLAKDGHVVDEWYSIACPHNLRTEL